MWFPRIRITIHWRENRCDLCGEPCGTYRRCRDCHRAISVQAQLKREWEETGRNYIASGRARTDRHRSRVDPRRPDWNREWVPKRGQPPRNLPPGQRTLSTTDIICDQLFDTWHD